MTGQQPEKAAPVAAPVPWLVLAAGIALLGLGLYAASRQLPEWIGNPGGRGGRVAALQADLARLGGRLQGPVADLSGASGEAYARSYRRLGPAATAYLAATGGGVAISVNGVLDVPGTGIGAFEAEFGPDGSYRSFAWSPGGMLPITPVSDEARRKQNAVYDGLEELLAGGVPRGPAETYLETTVPVVVRPLQGRIHGVEEAIFRIQPPNAVALNRQVADPEAAHRATSDALVQKILRSVVPLVATVLLVLVLFGRLLYRRRLDFRIALALGALILATAALTGPRSEGQALMTAVRIGAGLVSVAFLVAQWAVAESLLRDTVPGFTTSLDTLVAGRIGPRAGRALLVGLGAGAALEGLWLLVLSGATLLAPTVVPTRPSFSLPFFRLTSNPFYDGAVSVSTLVLLVALLRSFVPRKWADPAGGILAALVLSLGVPLAPWWVAFGATLLAAAAGLALLQRSGFSSLLAAGIAAPLFRDAFASAHLMTGHLPAFGLASGALVALALLGFVGLLRTPRDEEGKVAAPGYLQRLESERRVKFEMDLLSRMQLALLPQAPPDVPGLRVAFRSVLATEVGGDLYDFRVDADGSLWIAAGDVSGHGYSCGIQGAMVKASFLSLVKAGRSPGEILGEIDRVLRTAGETRLFTTLALVRIDPATGEAVWANAGHPYPFVVEEGRCRELACPGLPLGQGPERQYVDARFTIAPQGLLVFASDGLYEGLDTLEEPYGYDRPRAVLTSVGLWRRPAEGIVDALFADWRRHVGEGAPADDTTVVALKRGG